MSTSLTLHSGAKFASRDEVLAVATPERTDTHVPVPHGVLIDGLLSRLGSAGLNVVREQHGLGCKGNQWFGVFDLEAKVADQSYGLALGLRNAHDKSFAAAILMGSRVWICDNLAMSGEVRFVRKHTQEILTDLPRIMDESMVGLSRLEAFMHVRIAHYQQAMLSNRDAAYFIMRAVNERTLPVQRLRRAWQEWLKPTYEDFQPRTAWSLFNAHTEALKGSSFPLLPQRTQRLHLLMDQFTGTPKFESLANVKAGALEPLVVEEASEN